MVSGKIVMNVFKKQVPAGLKGLAGLLKYGSVIDKAERFTLNIGGNFVNDPVYSCVSPES